MLLGTFWEDIFVCFAVICDGDTLGDTSNEKEMSSYQREQTQTYVYSS